MNNLINEKAVEIIINSIKHMEPINYSTHSVDVNFILDSDIEGTFGFITLNKTIKGVHLYINDHKVYFFRDDGFNSADLLISPSNMLRKLEERKEYLLNKEIERKDTVIKEKLGKLIPKSYFLR